jgi:hypothetical protein
VRLDCYVFLHHASQSADCGLFQLGRINPDTPPSSESGSPTRRVNFAPLSPTSSRSLSKIHDTAAQSAAAAEIAARLHREVVEESDPDGEEHRDSHRRRRRRNSDPSSDRPNQPSKHRKRYRNASRSPSPSDDDSGEVEVLPDRFDKDGRPLDRYGNVWQSGGSGSGWRTSSFRSKDGRVKGGMASYRSDRDRDRDRNGGTSSSEMVERVVRDVGDVVEGRKSWKDLLAGFVEQASGAVSGSAIENGSASASPERRRRRRD